MSFAMLFSLPAFLSASVSLVAFWLAFTAWRYRQIPRARAFFAMVVAMSLWLVFYSLELFSVDLADKIVWSKFAYFGILSLPLGWAAFALAYTGREHWLTQRNIALFSIFPMLTLGIVFTNEWHGLIWSRIWLEQGGMMVDHGIWFWLSVAYSYSLIMLGFGQYVSLVVRSSGVYRWQALVMVLGACAPLVGNVLYLSEIITIIDPTPLFFSVSTLVFAWGLFRLGLLEIIPVAREQVIENMNDAVVVLSDKNRVLDLNPAARRMLGVETSAAIGRPAAELLKPWASLLERLQTQLAVQAEISHGAPGDQHYYDTRISSMIDRRGQLVGRLLVMLDITERRRVQEQLRHAQDEIRELKIKIDRGNQARQVAAITESDYFKELQKRAHELRKSRAQGMPPDENAE